MDPPPSNPWRRHGFEVGMVQNIGRYYILHSIFYIQDYNPTSIELNVSSIELKSLVPNQIKRNIAVESLPKQILFKNAKSSKIMYITEKQIFAVKLTFTDRLTVLLND